MDAYIVRWPWILGPIERCHLSTGIVRYYVHRCGEQFPITRAVDLKANFLRRRHTNDGRWYTNGTARQHLQTLHRKNRLNRQDSEYREIETVSYRTMVIGWPVSDVGGRNHQDVAYRAIQAFPYRTMGIGRPVSNVGGCNRHDIGYRAIQTFSYRTSELECSVSNASGRHVSDVSGYIRRLTSGATNPAPLMLRLSSICATYRTAICPYGISMTTHSQHFIATCTHSLVTKD